MNIDFHRISVFPIIKGDNFIILVIKYYYYLKTDGSSVKYIAYPLEVGLDISIGLYKKSNIS